MAGSRLETIKADSDHLRGDVARQLASDDPSFAKDTTQVLKFHGIYQQDDRDVRRQRAAQGLGKDYSCMVRAAIPGGILTASQYLAADELADAVGSGSLRITTRQALQYHFVRKGDLRTLVGTLNAHLVTTLAACGDVARNVMACPAPHRDGRAAVLGTHLGAIAAAVRPRTEAYWQLWVDGERAVSAEPVAPADVPPAAGDPAWASGDATEPLYGATYLPRKFKIGLAWPGDNCVDVHTHDVGLVPALAPDGTPEGFTVLVGGGLGMSHNNAATYPRLSDPLAFVRPTEVTEVVTTIIGVQRDHGDRDDRKHARLKYLVDDWGLDRFRGEVERRLGRRLDAPRPLTWDDDHDHLGWQRQPDGGWYLGVPVPSGRVVDEGGVRLRSALREVASRYATEVRFTPRQDVLLAGIADPDRAEVDALLAAHGVTPVERLTPVARTAMACPALPTCGLALTEAERALPALVDRLEALLAEVDLPRQALHVRVTGCPNGCARPYSTEVGIVGRGRDHYTVFLGGDVAGTRLNTPYADRVARADLPAVLRPVLTAYRDEHQTGEGFGDFCHRTGIDVLRRRFDPDALTDDATRRRRPVGSRA